MNSTTIDSEGGSRAPTSLFARQRLLLQLLCAMEPAPSSLDFQKILFLYCREERPDDPPYEFIPYKFGAFSFTCYADRRKLVERGLLEDDEAWNITPEGRRAAGPYARSSVIEFVKRHRGLRGDALVAHTYKRFPFFAIHSEVAERVLRGDTATHDRIRALRARPDGPELSTIGYEGHSLESYLTLLLRAGVTVLCDVRRNPISRKYGFSKKTLARGCEGVRLRYEHLPQLGIASDRRQELSSQSDYDQLFREYEGECLPEQGPSLDKIGQWIKLGERVALTCFERAPNQCHRRCVAEALVKNSNGRVVLKHL